MKSDGVDIPSLHLSSKNLGVTIRVIILLGQRTFQEKETEIKVCTENKRGGWRDQSEKK